MSYEHEPTRVIRDHEFHRQLSLLRRTRYFLIAEGVPSTIATNAGSESPFSLGKLNLLRDPDRNVPPLLVEPDAPHRGRLEKQAANA